MKLYVFLLGFVCCLNSFASSYGAYGHHNLGSGRVLGLAGAYTALSDDANAFFYNPSGTGFAKWKFNFDGGTNKLSNNELEISRYGFGEATVEDFYFFGMHIKQDWFSVGLGYVEPYSYTIKNLSLSSEKSLTVRDTVLNLAICPITELCVGANGKYSAAKLEEKISLTSTVQSQNLTNYESAFHLEMTKLV